MKQNNTNFIDGLVTDLKPRNVLKNSTLWLFSSGLLLLAAGLIFSIFGVREDYLYAYETGVFYWKPALFLMSGLGGTALMIRLSRPHTFASKLYYIPFVGVATLIIWQSLLQIPSQTFGTLQMIQMAFTPAAGLACIACIFLGGSAILATLWFTWLRHTAPNNPKLMGALAGFSSSSLAASAFVIHCSKDMMLYILTYYGLTIAALSIAGMVLGHRYLKW